MTLPQPLLMLEKASRRRAGRPAVQDLDLALERGQVLGLLGVNGAGKSTTLSMIAGALAPDAGRIDRKSTRLNSSHMSISYAVFCLKKKKIRTLSRRMP